MRIKTTQNIGEMSDADIANMLKSMGYDKYVAWDHYIIALGLNPRIDAKEFYALYGMASGVYAPPEIDIPFAPTHHDALRNIPVMITPDENGVYRMIWSDGTTGSNPPDCPPDHERYIPIGGDL